MSPVGERDGPPDCQILQVDLPSSHVRHDESGAAPVGRPTRRVPEREPARRAPIEADNGDVRLSRARPRRIGNVLPVWQPNKFGYAWDYSGGRRWNPADA